MNRRGKDETRTNYVNDLSSAHASEFTPVPLTSKLPQFATPIPVASTIISATRKSSASHHIRTPLLPLKNVPWTSDLETPARSDTFDRVDLLRKEDSLQMSRISSIEEEAVEIDFFNQDLSRISEAENINPGSKRKKRASTPVIERKGVIRLAKDDLNCLPKRIKAESTSTPKINRRRESFPQEIKERGMYL